MITAVKKWGNSMGVILPKEAIVNLHLKPGDEISLDIEKKQNVLKELFGFGKDNKITKDEFKETRRMLE